MGVPKKQNPANIKYLTIHCAATPEGRNVSAQTVSQWDIAKFGQVSYHHVIELDGTVVRTLQDDQVGAHTGGKNTNNIGICYVGGVDKNNKAPKDTRTEAQKISLARMISHYKKMYPNIIVLGHRDWPGVKKACPSFEVKDFLKELNKWNVPLATPNTPKGDTVKLNTKNLPPIAPPKAPEPVAPDFSGVKSGGSTYNPLTGKTERWGD